MNNGCVVVLTTIASASDGARIASSLVTERLAACVNVLPAMTSTFRWKGAIQTEEERQLVIKTSADRVEALRSRLLELHPYDLPEFIVLPVGGGSQEYLSWILESTRGTG